MSDLAFLWASLPRIDSLHASGDGVWAFWSWSGLAEVAEIYAAPADGTAAPVRLTHSTEHMSIRDVSQDGMRLILAHSPRSSEHDQLLLLDRTAENRLTPLTAAQTDHYIYGGSFAPGQKTIAYLSDFDDETGMVVTGSLRYVQSLATGARRVLFRSPDPFDVGPNYSPDGQHLLWPRHRRKPGAAQLWVIGADGSTPRQVLAFGESSPIVGHWLDAGRLVFVTDGAMNDRVGVLTLASGQIDWLAEAVDFNPQQLVVGQGGAFACHAFARAKLAAMVFDAEGRRQALPNRSGRRSLLPLARMPDGGWLAEAYDASAPHQVVRILASGDCLVLAAAPPNRQRAFSRPEEMVWASVDGMDCQGWLYRPKGVSRGLIVHVHGGPTWHSEDWVNPMTQFWVQSGFTVLDPNYRGSTGFGMEYREAVKVDGWGGREQADIRAAIEHLLAKGLAQKGRIAVAGNSYGGFSAWVAITRFADLVAAAIPMCGMYRLDIDYGATEMPWGRAYSEEMMGGSPEQVPEKYANASPGNFIHQIRGQVLVVHGLADSNVGPENTHIAVRELTAAGVRHEVLLFEDEGHGVTRTGNRALYLDKSLAFLARAFGEAGRKTRSPATISLA